MEAGRVVNLSFVTFRLMSRPVDDYAASVSTASSTARR